MTLSRPPLRARKDTNQAPIVAALRAMGFKVWTGGQPFDLLISRGDRVWMGEVKGPKKRGWKNEFTAAQAKLINDGWPVWIFYEIADTATFANEVFNG